MRSRLPVPRLEEEVLLAQAQILHDFTEQPHLLRYLVAWNILHQKVRRSKQRLFRLKSFGELTMLTILYKWWTQKKQIKHDLILSISIHEHGVFNMDLLDHHIK